MRHPIEEKVLNIKSRLQLPSGLLKFPTINDMQLDENRHSQITNFFFKFSFLFFVSCLTFGLFLDSVRNRKNKTFFIGVMKLEVTNQWNKVQWTKH